MKFFCNCFQCVAQKECYHELIEMETARKKQQECQKFFRGMGTDMVNIEGTTKCISLKKAYKYSFENRVVFKDFHLVMFLD